VDLYGKKPLLARLEVDGQPNLYGVSPPVATAPCKAWLASLTNASPSAIRNPP
jgi:hypothetical protein